MSELRVALIAEGPTDSVLIEAALKAILGRPFTLAPLQPEATRPQMGAPAATRGRARQARLRRRPARAR